MGNILKGLGLCILVIFFTNACGRESGVVNKTNPIPSIGALTPANEMTGSSGFTLTINGSGFVSSSIVRWNGADRPTSFVRNTQLKATIASSNIASNGTAQICVYNPAPGGGLSGTVPFVIHDSDLVITALNPTNRTTGGSAFSLTVNGTEFLASSIVRWNGSDRPTTFVSSTQLTAEITADDIALGGTAEVSVNTPSPNSATSNVLNFAVNNAIPIISTLSPVSRTLGGRDFTLTVRGSNFNPSSVVQWHEGNRTTTFVSSTQLEAIIPAKDVAAAIPVAVSVFNPAPGGGTSNSATFTVDSNSDNWTFLGTPSLQGIDFPGVEEIVIDKNDPNILYVTVYETGLFTSHDGGISWTLAITGTPPFDHSLISDPNTDDRVFYTQNNNLYVSINRGLTWNLLHTFDTGTRIPFLTVSTIDPHVIYAGFSGSDELFYSSPDDGLSWDAYSYGQTMDFDDFIPSAIAEDSVDGTLYVGFEWGTNPQTYDAPFLKSVDGGMTWENLFENITSSTGGFAPSIVECIVVNPNNQKVYILDNSLSLFTSMNQGTTWDRVITVLNIHVIVRDPYQEGRIFAGSGVSASFSGGIDVSTDDGAAFFPFGLQGSTVDSMALTGDGSYLYAAVYDSGIYYTPLP